MRAGDVAVEVVDVALEVRQRAAPGSFAAPAEHTFDDRPVLGVHQVEQVQQISDVGIGVGLVRQHLERPTRPNGSAPARCRVGSVAGTTASPAATASRVSERAPSTIVCRHSSSSEVLDGWATPADASASWPTRWYAK